MKHDALFNPNYYLKYVAWECFIFCGYDQLPFASVSNLFYIKDMKGDER